MQLTPRMPHKYWSRVDDVDKRLSRKVLTSQMHEEATTPRRLKKKQQQIKYCRSRRHASQSSKGKRILPRLWQRSRMIAVPLILLEVLSLPLYI